MHSGYPHQIPRLGSRAQKGTEGVLLSVPSSTGIDILETTENNRSTGKVFTY